MYEIIGFDNKFIIYLNEIIDKNLNNNKCIFQ